MHLVCGGTSCGVSVSSIVVTSLYLITVILCVLLQVLVL